MLGIIGGTSLLFSSLPKLKKETVATPFGGAEILSGDIVMLMRHQFGRPPHRINYRANLAAISACRGGPDRCVRLVRIAQKRDPAGHRPDPDRLYERDRHPLDPRP